MAKILFFDIDGTIYRERTGSMEGGGIAQALHRLGLLDDTDEGRP